MSPQAAQEALVVAQDDKPDGPIIFQWASDIQQQAVEATPGPPLLLMGGFNS